MKIQKIFKAQATNQAVKSLTKEVLAFLNEHLKDHSLLADLELVLIEACANVLEHGYAKQPGGVIELKISYAPPNCLRFVITDWGKPFAGDVPKTFHLTPEQESGRGLYIMTQLMDKITFDRQEEKNILIMEKNIRGNL